jgi:iron complex transport system substrate-binding protein
MSRENRLTMTRRSMLAAAGLAAFAPAWINAAGTPTAGTLAAGAWSFTDDRGKTIALPDRPTRVIAQTSAAAALWDCGFKVAGVFGPTKNADGSNDFQAGQIDLDEMVNLGDWGEMDLEKVIALNAQIYVDFCYGKDHFWYLTGDARPQLEALIPTLGISMEKAPITHSIARFEELAAAFGADLTAPALVQAKTAAADAETRLKTAIAAKPGLRLLAISPVLDSFYVCSPEMMTDLAYFASLGLDIVKPTLPADTADVVYFFEQLSWEQLGRYPADVILVDQRDPSAQSILDKQPLWATLPAVKAGQVGGWFASQQYSWRALAPIVTDLAALIERSSVVTG